MPETPALGGQPVDSLLLTETGWVKVGDVKIGDLIYSQDGNLTKITEVLPRGIKKVYKITFSDGSSAECCDDHPWITQDYHERSRRKRIGKRIFGKTTRNPKPGTSKTIKSIIESIFTKSGKINHQIPLCEPIRFSNKELPIHPYVLGTLIGDGCIIHTVTFSCAETETVEKLRSILDPNIFDINKKQSSKYDYSITDKFASWRRPNGIMKALKELGLAGKKSFDKFIPDIYKLNSIENRLDMLRGLMDTDGTTNGYHHSFCTTSEKLCEDIVFIAESLGGTATFKKKKRNFFSYKGVKKKGRDSFNVAIKLPNKFNPFSLLRKSNKVIGASKYPPRRFIFNVEASGEKECFRVSTENPSNLCVTNKFVVSQL